MWVGIGYMSWKCLYYITNTSEAIRRNREVEVWGKQSSHFIFSNSFHSSSPYTEYFRQVFFWQLCATLIILDLPIILTFFFINLLRPVLQMLCISSVRTVDNVTIRCAFSDCYSYHWIPIWQECHWVSSNCTVVLQADVGYNQQTNVNYFN